MVAGGEQPEKKKRIRKQRAKRTKRGEEEGNSASRVGTPRTSRQSSQEVQSSVCEREMAIVGIETQGLMGEPVVVLREKSEPHRIIPIWIGPLEAHAILVGWQRMPIPRPLTADLLMMVLGALGARLDRVVITTVALDTYFARLEVVGPDNVRRTLDARPSDALALAVRAGAPIYASEELLQRAGFTAQQEGHRPQQGSSEGEGAGNS